MFWLALAAVGIALIVCTTIVVLTASRRSFELNRERQKHEASMESLQTHAATSALKTDEIKATTRLKELEVMKDNALFESLAYRRYMDNYYARSFGDPIIIERLSEKLNPYDLGRTTESE